jgi:hypothetical protein
MRLARVHEDGPTHTFEDGAERSLCQRVAAADALLPADTCLCHRCSVRRGVSFADPVGDPAWQV